MTACARADSVRRLGKAIHIGFLRAVRKMMSPLEFKKVYSPPPYVFSVTTEIRSSCRFFYLFAEDRFNSPKLLLCFRFSGHCGDPSPLFWASSSLKVGKLPEERAGTSRSGGATQCDARRRQRRSAEGAASRG